MVLPHARTLAASMESPQCDPAEAGPQSPVARGQTGASGSRFHCSCCYDVAPFPSVLGLYIQYYIVWIMLRILL